MMMERMIVMKMMIDCENGLQYPVIDKNSIVAIGRMLKPTMPRETLHCWAKGFSTRGSCTD